MSINIAPFFYSVILAGYIVYAHSSAINIAMAEISVKLLSAKSLNNIN